MKNVRPYTARLFAAVLAASAAVPVVAMAENSATVGGVTFVNKGLVGVGRIPANLKDKFGETFGSGSGMSIDAAGWTHGADGYKGSLWLLPDRGYNVVGTTDYRPRLNTIAYRVRAGRTGRRARRRPGTVRRQGDACRHHAVRPTTRAPMPPVSTRSTACAPPPATCRSCRRRQWQAGARQ